MMPLVALAFIPMALALPAPYRWAASSGATPPGVAPLSQCALLPGAHRARSHRLVGARYPRDPGGAARGLSPALGSPFMARHQPGRRGLDPVGRAALYFIGVRGRHRHPADPFGARFRGARRPEAQAIRATADLGGLIIATLLGTVYIVLMSYIVIWYGNLPEKAAWYLRRGARRLGLGRSPPPWQLARSCPFALLLNAELSAEPARAARRRRPGPLRRYLLHVVWLLAPAFRAARCGRRDRAGGARQPRARACPSGVASPRLRSGRWPSEARHAADSPGSAGRCARARALHGHRISGVRRCVAGRPARLLRLGRPRPVVMPPRPFASPALQTNRCRDLAKLQAEQRGRLEGYAWVDRDNGVVRIPIEQRDGANRGARRGRIRSPRPAGRTIDRREPEEDAMRARCRPPSSSSSVLAGPRVGRADRA